MGVIDDASDVAYLTGFSHMPTERPVAVRVSGIAGEAVVLLLPELECDNAEQQGVLAEMTGAALDPLLEPLKIGSLGLRNRIVSTSHAPHYAEDGLPSERYREYHIAKARSGIALTMIGGSSSVAVDSPFRPEHIDLSSDRVIPHLESLARGVHAEGAAVMCQITHRGRRQAWDEEPWLPLIAPSALAERAWGSTPKSMEAADFPRVIDAFAQAVLGWKEAGLEGVEVEAPSDHLLEQLLSSAANRRIDEYGGPLKERTRFLREVLEAVRSAVGRAFVVVLRLAVAEGIPDSGGIQLGARLKAARAYVSRARDPIGHVCTATDFASIRRLRISCLKVLDGFRGSCQVGGRQVP